MLGEKSLKINKKKIRYHMFKLGCCFLFASTVLMICTFFIAFFHPTKIVTVAINLQGEAILEAALICVLIPILIFVFYELKFKVLPKIKEGTL